MGSLYQKIERSQLVAGDHIYTWRTDFPHSHHGIYIGNCWVIHFTDCSSTSYSTSSSNTLACSRYPVCGLRRLHDSGVVLSCLDCFLAGGSLHRFEYQVPLSDLFKLRDGTHSTAQPDTQEALALAVVSRAAYGYAGFGGVYNNCKHFAFCCKTGLGIIGEGIGQRVGDVSRSYSYSIEEVLELEKPPMAANAIGLNTRKGKKAWKSRAGTMKDDFLKRLATMDPLVPREMVAFANSSLRALAQFPFVDIDSLFFSIQDFVITAHKLACAKEDVQSRGLEIDTTYLEKTRERIQVLTKEHKVLSAFSFISLEAKIDLKDIEDRLEPVAAGREHEVEYFRRVQSKLEETSKELSDAFHLLDQLELPTLFQEEINDHLADLEGALGDARARLLS